MSGFTIFLLVCGIILSLKILKEIEEEEKLELINSGDCNSDNRNSGNCNCVDCCKELEELKEENKKLNVLFAELENENAELDCQRNRNKSCYSCANATERCFRNEIGCPCQKYKSYTEENAELEKAYNETEELLDKQIEATYKVVEENKEAKEIIEKLLPYAKTGKHDKQDLQSIDRFCDSIHKAEQFLKESE